ncbi:hypothetical protein Dimus_034769 [Dionaea muscipula]
MSIKLHRHSFISSCSSTQWITRRSIRIKYWCEVVDFDRRVCNLASTSTRHLIRCMDYEERSHPCSCRHLRFQKHHLVSHKTKKTLNLLVLASNDDGIAVNGSPQTGTDSDVEAMRIKLDQSLQNEDFNNGLVQALHDAARVFELSIKEQRSLSRISWFSAAWLGVDINAWAKGLSYQAAVYSLLQAAIEISSSGDGRDRDANLLVQRSLLRLCAPLESIISEKLSAKQPDLSDWFWSEKIPVVVTTFVNHFERDPRFVAATVSGKRIPSGSNNSHVSLLMLALTCTAAIMKLGPAKISSSQFFSILPDVAGRFMDMLVLLVPIHEAYHSVKDIGLHKEFLVHFGPRAASPGIIDDYGADEIIFWVDLVQNQLQRAMDREKIWSRLTTSESIEVLEKDLAIFGFFVALGRSTQSFLAANGIDKIDEPIEGFIRYLIGGIVLYYPQLSTISSYQLYVEVVCEELEWLPFYPGYANTVKSTHGNKPTGPPNMEAIPKALDVCSHWIWSFIKHSKWLGNPSNVKATRFLSKGDELLKSKALMPAQRNKPIINTLHEDLESFDQALGSVEEALVRLEKLLQEVHVCSSRSEKEQLKAACSELEKIRRLKKEAEFLEASFTAKAASLQQGADESQCRSSTTDQTQYIKGKSRMSGGVMQNKDTGPVRKSRGLWSFLVRPLMKNAPERLSSDALDEIENGSTVDAGNLHLNEFHRFEVLRNELMELEKRVKTSTDQSENDEEVDVYGDGITGAGLVTVQRNGNIIEKSLDKLKETSTDVWQGTQLLAIDVAAAMGFMRRMMIGDELTEKEKKALRRTFTDLASVVPIGVLMLLPVTAVGHAAMLAAIQRYVPALIPSTYGRERLDLLRKLQKVKEIEADDAMLDQNVDELAS